MFYSVLIKKILFSIPFEEEKMVCLKKVILNVKGDKKEWHLRSRGNYKEFVTL